MSDKKMDKQKYWVFLFAVFRLRCRRRHRGRRLRDVQVNRKFLHFARNRNNPISCKLYWFQF